MATQKLIQPLNNMRLTASYKNKAYLGLKLGEHYGIDCADKNRADFTVWGMGSGEIVDCGLDSILGNFIVVMYPGAYNRVQKRTADIIIRLYHLDRVDVHIGQKITKDTRFGLYGNTGKYSQGKHLHIEVDEDTDKRYTHYTPTITGNSSKFKGRSAGANDKTMSNPLDWMHCKTSAPDNQTYTTDGTIYINAADKTAVKIQ